MAAAAELRTAPVQRGTLVAAVNAAGNIAARAETTLAFRTTGAVTAVHVQEGDRVEAGQVLMELDTTDLELDVAKARLLLATAEAQLAKTKAGPTQAQLAAAEAALKAAQDNYQRVLGKPDPSEEAQVEQARLSLQQAERRLEEAKLVAPFAGTVVAVNYREGEYVSTSQPAVALADLSTLEIEVPLEMDVASVVPGRVAGVEENALALNTPDGPVKS